MRMSVDVSSDPLHGYFGTVAAGDGTSEPCAGAIENHDVLITASGQS